MTPCYLIENRFLQRLHGGCVVNWVFFWNGKISKYE